LTDIDGETRSTTSPDIGADEYTPEPSDKTLTVEVFLEGLYNGSNTMRQAFDENGPHFGPGIADQIVIELHNASGYGNIAYTSPPVNLGTNGQAVITVPGAFSGSYYITIRHRNSLATTTAAPVSFSNSNVELNLDHPTKAFGGNLLMMIDGKYVIYGGDVNQDGSVDTADMTPVDNDASAFATGYLATDVNGDGTIDTGDMTIIDNNAAAFVSSITP
ncbi:dockerin type I domain-containing protein, partial [Lentimicrobium sp.]|uniref:dockerin type I domain-containing protein n=1 Tax=Lentimicrobium sp. TaxID=2034841 RepID=UPI002B8EDF98